MALLKIKALDSFSHGRLNVARGDEHAIEASEARDLEKAGLVSTSPAGDDDVDDLVGTKMAPLTSNKMDNEPVKNKAVKNTKAE